MNGRHSPLTGLSMRQLPVNVEAEQALLGAILAGSAKAFPRVEAFLEPWHFADPVHSRIYKEAAKIARTGGVADVITLNAVFVNSGILDEVGGVKYLGQLIAASNGWMLSAEYGRAIVQAWVRRELIGAAEEMVNQAFASGDVDDTLVSAISAVEKLSVAATAGSTKQRAKTLLEAVDAALQHADAVYRGDGFTGVTTGMASLDDALGGFENGDLVVIGGRPGSGKAQPTDSKVLMSDGSWKKMGELRFGDDLASIDGAPSKVRAVHERGERQVFRITLRDGRSTEACADHLWSVKYRDWPDWRILSTETLQKILTKKRYQKRISIENVSGHFGGGELQLDPYVLGALLGDGGFTGLGVKLSSADQEIVDEIQRRLGTATEVRRIVGSYSYSLTSRSLPGRITEAGRRHGRKVWNRTVYPVRTALTAMGLAGLRSEAKFVPPEYLLASHADRLDLLRGLMDTDGTVGSLGNVTFASTSRQLALDVQTLVRSLGGQCKIANKQTGCKVAGVYKLGLPSFVCNIRHPHGEKFFLLARKSDRAKRGRNSSVSLSVVSVEPTRSAETRCITVTHPSGLYVTDDYIVTHNSSIAWQWAISAARRGEGVLAISMEMTAAALGRRALSTASGVPIRKMRRGQHTDDVAALLAARKEMLELPLSIEDGGRTSAADIATMCRLAQRKHGLQLVMVDHLQISKPDEQDARSGPTAAIAGFTHSMKELAKRLECPVILLSQLSRGVVNRDDHRPNIADLRQAGAIEEDADVVAFVHRPELYIGKSPPERLANENDDKLATRTASWHASKLTLAGTAEFIIEKLREGEPKMVPLLFDGPTATFRERIQDEAP